MKRFIAFQLIPFLVVALLIPSASADIPGLDSGEPNLSVGRIQIPFIQNQGQVADEVAFYARTFGGTLFVTKNGQINLTIPGQENGKSRLGVIREEIQGGLSVPPEGLEVSPTRISSIVGNDPGMWRMGVSAFHSVDLGSVYEGIDLRLQAYGNSVEKIFTVSPGADPSRIRMRVGGVEGLAIGEEGTLIVKTKLGDVSYTAPVAYQETDHGVHDVRVAYQVEGRTYGFEVGPYDRERPLIIDPILGATYLGGDMNDQAYSMDFGESGKLYVTGLTYSPNFPGIDSTSAQSVLNSTGSGTDVFIALLDPTLGIIHQATYLGGTLWDEPGYGSGGGPTIAVHPLSGKVYVTGLTQSMNFPMVSSGYDSVLGDGSGDAFVARLDANLTTVEAATYYGSGDMDLGTALAVDPQYGDIYITGRTQSTDLPGTEGGYQPDYTSLSGWDGFVARFSQDLDTLVQATYIGMSGDDYPYSMAVDMDDSHPSYGFVFVTGEGSSNAYVYKLAPYLTSGSVISLGGDGGDIGYGITIQPDTGDIYLCGTTSSSDFPGTSGGAQPAHAGTGYNDAFVTSLAAHLGTIRQSTYLGGTDSESNCSLFIEPASGDVYLAGTTFSSDFPGTTGGIQPDNAGDNDVFTARLSGDLTTLYQATYFGGSSREMTFAIDSEAIGNGLYITGLTWSGDLPGMTDTYSAQPTHGGVHYMNGKDGFVVRLDSGLLAGSSEPDISVNPLSLDFGTIAVGDTRSLPVGIANYGVTDLTIDLVQLDDGTIFTLDTDRATLEYPACDDYLVSDAIVLQAGEICAMHVVFTPLAQAAYSDTLSLGSDDPDEGLVEIPLEGAGGTGPDIEVYANTGFPLDFGPVMAFGDSDWRSIRVENLGDSPLIISDLTLSDNLNFFVDIDTYRLWSGGDFPCGDYPSLTGLFELEEDEGCKFAVVFAPEDHGVLEETLEIVSNDPNHPSVFASLTGGTDIGLAGVYLYGDPTPAYYGFNILYLNDPEEILQGTFRITNYGAVSYTVTNILLGDILPADVVDASVITGQSGLCPHPPFALGGMGYCDFVIDLYLEKVGVFDGEVNLDIEPGGIEIQGYFDGDVRRSSSSSVCSISKPGAGTGTVHIVLLAVFLGGLYAWRRKRLP